MESVCEVPPKAETACVPRIPVTPPKGRPKAATFFNVLWNWLGIVTESLVGFFLAPFLIETLGDDTYGLWILIGAFTGYFGMLDLGLRGAVGRFVALYAANGDQHKVNQTLSTAAATLALAGVVSFIAILASAPLFPLLFAISTEQMAQVQTALFIVGSQFALWFILRIFDAALWAKQRFDLLNRIDIPLALARAGLTWWFVSSGGGLITLAWIGLAVMLANGLTKCYFTFREFPSLQLHRRFLSRAALHELVGYGAWNSLVSLMAMARTQGMPVVIGAAVGMRFLGPFSVVMRLPALATAILTAATGVFTPLAIRLHAEQDSVRRRQLVLEGTQLSLSLALYFVVLFICVGGPLLSLWIRPDFAAYGVILAVIGCGEVLPMAMSIPQGVLLAMARHQRMASWVVLETVLALVASAMFGNYMGLLGVAFALATAATLFRGVLVMRQICEVIDIGQIQFFREAMLIPILTAVPSAGAFLLMMQWHVPQTWGALIAYTLLFSVFNGASVLICVVGVSKIRNYRGRLATV
jgi:O-antigen/teichoic acid export membrane protein